MKPLKIMTIDDLEHIYQPLKIEELRLKYGIKKNMSNEVYEANRKKAKTREIQSKIKDDVVLHRGQFYKNNPFLKRENVEVDYTNDMIEEYERLQNDPILFINMYGTLINIDYGIVPYKTRPYQDEIISACHNFDRVVLNTSRQIGKCVCGDTEIEILNAPKAGWKKMLYNKLCELKSMLNN